MMMHHGRKVLDGTLDTVKAQRARETVRVVFGGEPPSLAGLKHVSEVKDYGREKSLVLAPGEDPQALLGELLGRGQLLSFEIARSSLHEVFVSIAGEGRAPEPSRHGAADAE
jgi:ABC-type uncharacterized transport system ATPase subunit